MKNGLGFEINQALVRIEKPVNDFAGVIKEYRKKKMLSIDSLAMRVGCSAAFMFRVEKGSRIIPLHMRVRILKKGLLWRDSEVEQYLVEIGEQNSR
ncbi:helix-turn-helix domain-containing protein [Virgibacillus halodenitrificans]|uniref:helix-turn-helix domain-containing protein n=1 Tax=Virgibacillus halodenitrificans TaxID=1482 RepID=UPI00045CA413|nr:helix-turn-helix transcriptional regulator [Virgibacillus halodenitrificans]CDQ36778.1 hypothetical protein BN993_06290 [Virgibacillus halodenitrificans]